MEDILNMGDKGLAGDLVSGTYTGELSNIEASFLAENGKGTVALFMDFNYDTNYVHICTENPVFSRGTVEATTLSSFAMLFKANAFYNSLNTHISLPKVQLNILPKMSFKISVKVSKDAEENDTSGMLGSVAESLNNRELNYSLTDNAAWGLPESDSDSTNAGTSSLTPEFYIFPQSQEAISQSWFGAQPLWELPFVLHHEFGHHIFYVYVPKLFTDNYNLKRYAQKLGGNIFMRTGIKSVDHLLAGDYAPATEVATAINEGFADLYAHYSLNGATEIDSIKCMQGTRDVTSRLFYDGVEKQLTGSVWQEFGANEEKTEDTGPIDIPSPENINCAEYDYKDPHIIGALLAHGIYSLWEGSDLGNGDGQSLQRGAALLDWLSALNSEIGSWNSGFELMNMALRKAFAVARENTDSAHMSELCSIMENKFPYFYDYWENHSVPSELSECLNVN